MASNIRTVAGQGIHVGDEDLSTPIQSETEVPESGYYSEELREHRDSEENSHADRDDTDDHQLHQNENRNLGDSKPCTGTAKTLAKDTEPGEPPKRQTSTPSLSKYTPKKPKDWHMTKSFRQKHICTTGSLIEAKTASGKARKYYKGPNLPSIFTVITEKIPEVNQKMGEELKERDKVGPGKKFLTNRKFLVRNFHLNKKGEYKPLDDSKPVYAKLELTYNKDMKVNHLAGYKV